MKKLMLPMALIAGLGGGLMSAPTVAINDKVVVQSTQYRIEQRRRRQKSNSDGLSPVGGCDKKSIAARRRRQGYDSYAQAGFIQKAQREWARKNVARRINYLRCLKGKFKYAWLYPGCGALKIQ